MSSTLPSMPFLGRKLADQPCNVVVVHGGPGAPGSVSELADELAEHHRVLEPYQTALTIDGQVDELRAAIEDNCTIPVALIGWSWGAWLVFILAARHPNLVRKLILVDSGPFDARYTEGGVIMKTRMERLAPEDRAEVERLADTLESNPDPDPSVLARFGDLLSKADSFDPVDHPSNDAVDIDVYKSVWPEAAEMRRSGTLLGLASQIKCPVVAIHGDYDPHPAAGVEEPLSKTLSDFEFILLENCGHTPWHERQARDEFFRVLRTQIPTTR